MQLLHQRVRMREEKQSYLDFFCPLAHARGRNMPTSCTAVSGQRLSFGLVSELSVFLLAEPLLDL